MFENYEAFKTAVLAREGVLGVLKEASDMPIANIKGVVETDLAGLKKGLLYVKYQDANGAITPWSVEYFVNPDGTVDYAGHDNLAKQELAKDNLAKRKTLETFINANFIQLHELERIDFDKNQAVAVVIKDVSGVPTLQRVLILVEGGKLVAKDIVNNLN